MPISFSWQDADMPITRRESAVAVAEPEPLAWQEGYPLAQVGSELAYTPDEVVYLAVQLLAGNDPDFAATRNDIGFNRLHARHGHTLAARPLADWTEYDLWSARKMLETYKNTQLKGLVEHMPAFSKTPPLRPYEVAQQRRAMERGIPVASIQPAVWRHMTIGQVGAEYVVTLDQSYDPDLVAQIKGLPQRRYDADKKQWYVPLQLDALEPLLEFAAANGYDIPDEVGVAMEKVLAQFQETMELSRAGDVDKDFDLPPGLELFPFQKAGVAYAERVGNVLIADEMGLGKTVQALVTVKLADQFPCIVVCPASLKRNWEREANKWLPGRKVRVLDGNFSPLRFMNQGFSMWDVVIVNYNSRILSKWLGQLVDISPASIILDECHAIKNPKAQQSKLVQELVAETKARVIALSGTPVVNRPMEFFQIVKALGHAKTLGGYSEYKRRYDNSRTEAHHELNTRARTHFMVRRLKKDVLTELPPKMYSTIPIEIINRDAYRKAEADIAGFFATKKSQDAKFLKDVIAYCDAKHYEGETREKFIDAAKAQHYNASYAIAAQNEALLRWEALKQLAVQGKMPAVMEWIEDFLESGEKLVVFCTHTAIGQAIAAKFDADFIHGGVSPDERQPMVDAFQTDPERKVIVGNLIAMGEGLTLTAASNVVFVELGWNRKQHAQAEDRCHRIGQHDSVMVYHLVAEDTIEQEIIALIERKRVISEAIQDGDESTQRQMMAELATILEERLAKRRGAE